MLKKPKGILISRIFLKIVKKGNPKKLRSFYDFVREWVKELEYKIYMPLEEEIFQHFCEAHRYNDDAMLVSNGTSKDTDYSKLKIKTLVHPDGTFDVKFSLENKEHHFKTERTFNENTISGPYVRVYVVKILTKYSCRKDKFVAGDEE